MLLLFSCTTRRRPCVAPWADASRRPSLHGADSFVGSAKQGTLTVRSRVAVGRTPKADADLRSNPKGATLDRQTPSIIDMAA